MLFASIDPSQPRPEAKPVNVDLTVAATPASQTADHWWIQQLKSPPFGQTVDRHWRIPERQKQSKQSPATASLFCAVSAIGLAQQHCEMLCGMSTV